MIMKQITIGTCMWVCAIGAFGATIQFNMGDGTAYSGTEAPAGLSDSVWNAPSGDVASGLLYSDGTSATGVTLDTGVDANTDGIMDWAEMGQWRNSGSLSGGTDVYGTTLMEKYWYGRSGQNLGVRVSGLAAGEYNVYSLVREHNQLGRTYDVGVGVNTSTWSELAVSSIGDATGVTTWSEGYNYVKHTVTVSGTSDFISVIVDNTNNNYACLQGLQIESIPEPATLGLMAVFGGGVLLVRRRFMM